MNLRHFTNMPLPALVNCRTPPGLDNSCEHAHSVYVVLTVYRLPIGIENGVTCNTKSALSDEG